MNGNEKSVNEPRNWHRPGVLFEISVNAVIWITWIIVMNSGTENGIGYFHQPGHDLLLPLINGAVFNAALFFGNAFWLMPNYLATRRFGTYLVGLGALCAGVMVFKTLAERLMIVLAYPDLRDLPLRMLALENLWALLAMIVLSLFYRFGRDWITGGNSRPEDSLEGEPSAIWIKSGTSRERLMLEDILYIKALDNYVVFELKDRSLMALMTMKKVQDLLPKDSFLRIHRSHIIALDKVESVSSEAVVINENSLPIGKTYRKDARKRLAETAT